MTRYILIVAGILVVSGSIQAQCSHGSDAPKSTPSQTALSAETKSNQPQVQAKCPVMGNTVVRSISTIWEGDTNYSPKKIYFCCPPCIDKFKANPIKYIKKLEKMKQPIENAAVAKEVWICTMCPDVKSDKPGTCSKCGIGLVKKV